MRVATPHSACLATAMCTADNPGSPPPSLTCNLPAPPTHLMRPSSL